MKRPRFTKFEDETIQSFAEVYSHNLSESFRLSASILKRDVNCIRQRYYRKRGEYRHLFYLPDNKKDRIPFNTKVYGGKTKFRDDLFVPINKDKSPPLRLSNFTVFRNSK